MNELHDLQVWYHANCNGDWEHSYGIELQTLDNPGWLLKIDLVDTALALKSFEPVIRAHDVNWLNCRRSESQFIAAGGPIMLGELISVFLKWSCDEPRGQSCSTN